MNNGDGPARSTARRHLPLGKILLWTLGGLMLAALGLFGLWQRHCAACVAEQLALLRTSGEPFTAAEMEAYYRLPDGREDCTQLYLAAFKDLYNPSFPIGIADNLIECGRNRLSNSTSGRAWDELEAAEEFLSEYQNRLDHLHVAARLGGGGRYPMDFSQGVGMTLLSAHGTPNAVRLLMLESVVRAHRRDATGTTESLRAMWRVSESLEFEPTEYSQWIRVVCSGLSLSQIQELMETVDFADDDLRMLQSEFREFDASLSLLRGLLGERAMGYHAIEHYDIVDFEPRPSWIDVLLLNTEKAYFLEQMSRLIEAASAPGLLARTELLRVRAEVKSDLLHDDWQKYGKSMAARLIHDHFDVTEASYQVQARAATVDAALAAELFRRQHGRAPATLKELVPDFLPAVPLDPFDGQPLRMVVQGDTLVIYSVGPDGADDGGEEDDRKGKPDVVFRLKDKR